MPRQNRVTPHGVLVAAPARGTLFGNRGCLHDDTGRIVRWAVGRRWIACELAFKDRLRARLLAPGRYTELFFLDEATALAAGHRPCAECRRSDFVRFADAFAAGNALGARSSARDVDARLHPERPARSGPRLHDALATELPDGAMIELDRGPHLVLDGRALPWSLEGYGAAVQLTGAAVKVITPPCVVRALAAGYAPRLHPSARERDPAGATPGRRTRRARR